MNLTQEHQEQSNVEMLTMLMGDVVDSEVARKVLRKHKGDVEKAADAILNGDRGEVTAWTPTQATQDASYAAPSPSIPPLTLPSIIDLTGDDHEYTRALQMSMETSQPEPTFRPTDRAPDPAWQMVPSNVQVDTRASQEEQTLNDAIQASLNDFVSDESDRFPLQESVREGGRPIALRPETPSLAYAALVLQALFFIPQVRSSVANLTLPDIDINLPRDSPARAIWNLIELFTNMDLAQLSAIVDKEVLPSLNAVPLDVDSPSGSSPEFVKSIGELIEEHLNAQTAIDAPEARLFTFTHGNVELSNKLPRKIRKNPAEGSVVCLEIGGDDPVHNDLVPCLSSSLTTYTEGGSSHDVIIEPPEFVGFQLRRRPTSTKIEIFNFPKTICMDQFMFENLELANSKRDQERTMLADIVALKKQKENLTHFNSRDSLKDLRATLHYFEHVAEAKDDTERRRTLDKCTLDLKNILSTICTNVERLIDKRIDTLQAEMSTLFECPELQNHQYDLRAVLMHTGLPGRKQMYSYVVDYQGTWWKTVDHSVTEVSEETVFTDPTGVHLNAGPYLLLYSRHLSTEELNAPVTWPKQFTESVMHHNRTLLACLSQDTSTNNPDEVLQNMPEVLSSDFLGIKREDTISMDLTGD